MARPHLDWQQLGSLQFSPLADRMGMLTRPTMSQLILKFAYSPTATTQNIPINAALALQPQNEQPHESSYFISPSSIWKPPSKSLAWKAMHSMSWATFLTSGADERQEIWSQFYPAIYLFPLCFMNIATAMCLLGPRVLCNAGAQTITFVLTADDNLRRQGVQHYATIPPPCTVALLLVHYAFHWSRGVNIVKERVLAHCSPSYQRTNWSHNDRYLLSRQPDYRNWSYNYREQYKRMFHWPECHAVLANGNKIGSLRGCVIDFGQMVCWFFDYATLLWLDESQTACQAQRSWGRLMRRWRVHKIRGDVEVEEPSWQCKAISIKSQNVEMVRRENAARTMDYCDWRELYNWGELLVVLMSLPVP